MLKIIIIVLICGYKPIERSPIMTAKDKNKRIKEILNNRLKSLNNKQISELNINNKSKGKK